MRIHASDLRVATPRIPLHEVVPLAAPFSLYIEPTSLCNLGCKFCPTGHRHLMKMRPNGTMSLDLFCKIVDDIGQFGRKLKRVNLYKDGEPLLNKQFPEMVRYLKDANVVETIWTKTNGVPLNPALNARLVDCGLDFIGVSINGVDAKSYLEVTQRHVDYEKLVDGVADLYARRTFKIYVKIADSGLAPEQIDRFYADFEDKCDYIAVEYLHGWSASGTMDFQLGTRPDTFEGFPLVEKIACPLPFFMLGINWDGSASLCNEDWMHKTVVGDLTQEHLFDVWNGERLREARRMHLEGRRSENPMCGNCHYLTTLPDNIDPYREELLGRL